MRTYGRLLRIATLAIAAHTPLAAQQTKTASRPDFTGTWVMDTTKSNRDGVLPQLTLVVERTGDTLSVRSEGSNARGPFVSTSRYGFDGKPWQNTLGGGFTLTTLMSWEGSTLVFTSTGNANGQSITTTDRWTLDSAATHLTRQSTFAVNGQVRSEVLILARK